MTDNTRILDRFEYHLKDIDCRDCIYFKGKRKQQKNGCWEEFCRFSDIRQEAEDKLGGLFKLDDNPKKKPGVRQQLADAKKEVKANQNKKDVSKTKTKSKNNIDR